IWQEGAMYNTKSVLWWKRALSIFALILVTTLTVKIAPGQDISTLKSAFGEKDIKGTEIALADRLGKSEDLDLVKSKLMEDRMTVEKAGRTVVPDLKNAGYSDKEATSGLAWTWYELRAGQHAVPLTTKLSMATIQARAAKLGRLIIKSKPNDA